MAYPIATIDAVGIHAPLYEDVLGFVQDAMRTIYGADIYLENDSQDGQMAAIWAKSLHDANSAFVQTYNAFSPSTAQGVGLSSVVKINGISRHVATNSSVDLVINGDVGAQIINGIATDPSRNRWLLPPLVTIGLSGVITVGATAATVGATRAAANTITEILTPTRGWVTVNNPADAIVGAPVESDAELRQRQAVSTALPAISTEEGLYGAIFGITGVQKLKIYSNDDNVTDVNGIPSHSIGIVVQGGETQQIAQMLLLKKGQGVGTAGTTVSTIVDAYGIPHFIRFWRTSGVAVTIDITIKPLAGYVTATGEAIKAAVLAETERRLRVIGQPVYPTRLYRAADSLPLSDTFDLISITASRVGVPNDVNGNVPINFREIPVFGTVNLTVIV